MKTLNELLNSNNSYVLSDKFYEDIENRVDFFIKNNVYNLISLFDKFEEVDDENGFIYNLTDAKLYIKNNTIELFIEVPELSLSDFNITIKFDRDGNYSKKINTNKRYINKKDHDKINEYLYRMGI